VTWRRIGRALLIIISISGIIWIKSQPLLWIPFTKAIPGLIAFVITFVTPRAGSTALESIRDGRIDNMTRDPTSKGVMDLYLQLTTVSAGLFTLFIIALIYTTAQTPVLNTLAFITSVFTIVVISYIWILRGIRDISIEPYIKTFDKILPPWTGLTYLRYSLAIIASLLAIAAAFSL